MTDSKAHAPDSKSEARPRVLVFAHFCGPDEGSEAAAGWGVVDAVAEFADVTVLVLERYVDGIERYLRDNPHRTIRCVGVPMPEWGQRLDRTGIHAITEPVWYARYIGWLYGAKRIALKLHADSPFDVAIHAAVGAYWLPTPMVDLPMPTVWGPVGGAARSDPRLWRYLSPVGVARELAEAAVARLVALSPWTRRTWSRATIRMVETDAAMRRMPRRLRPETRMANRAILTERFEVPEAPRLPYVAFPSGLVRRKGPALAIHALAHTPDSVRLVFIHEGPEEPHLRKLVSTLGLDERVEFRGRVPREEMRRIIGEAAAMVFTGLHEEGGCALAEAMLAGAPVILLGHGGARQIGEAATDPDRIALIDPAGATETARRIGEAMTRFCASPSEARTPYLDQESTKKALRSALEDAISGA